MIPQVLNAHAKVNLSLEVLGRRNDGFHEVNTRIVQISLSDELHFNPSKSGEFEFTCSEPSIPSDEGNLVVKAANAFRDKADINLPVHIHLEKSIPSGAGLGGGSSDAATTLKGLNKALGNKLSHDALHEIAASLGSDINFFLDGSVADCTGRGEMVTPASFPFELPLVLYVLP